MNLQLNLHPSRYLLAFILLTHVGAMLCLLALPLQWWAMLLIEICLIGSFIHGLKKHIIRSASSTIVKVWVDENNKWYCLQRDGTTLAATLRGDSVSSQPVVILNFNLSLLDKNQKPKNKKITVLVFPDSVAKTEYRRLKAWMNSH